MKTITGKDAFEILSEAFAYVVMDSNEALVYGAPEAVAPGEYEFQIGYDDRQDYYFSWIDIDNIKIENNQLYLPEEEGELIGIKLLQIQQL